MNVLVVGSGGREHALAWAVAASPLADAVFCAPGNGGMASLGRCLAIDPMDSDGLIAACREFDIDFVIIGPESPLASGLTDRLIAAGIKTFGPSAKAARLEASKGFAKELCQRADIPSAPHARFTGAAAAKAYLKTLDPPFVVKADGLAAGKGVVITENINEAAQAIDSMLQGALGEAGREVVIEEFLEGEEASFFALCDGEHVLPLATAQDHKRAYDGDTGPNTGGMGANSPAPIMTADLSDEVMRRIVEPTVRTLAADGTPYVGVLYAGLMITAEGPKLIEYNVRFGDPETQVLVPRLKSDLLPLLVAATDGVLDAVDVRWHEDAALTVVMAAKGYPGAYEKGSVIRNLDGAEKATGCRIFHAGTVLDDGVVKAAGGRVLDVTALGKTVSEAAAKAYACVDLIDWPEGFCRRDIGWRAIERERS